MSIANNNIQPLYMCKKYRYSILLCLGECACLSMNSTIYIKTFVNS